MSNSELFVLQENNEEIEFKILLQKPKLQFQDGIAFQIHQERENNEKQNQEQDQDREECKNSSRKLSLGELEATNDDDDNDGFKTPTSLDHKIPVIKQCPPAPRKPPKLLLSNTKRKSSHYSQPNNARRSLQLDLSQEVESLFPRPILADFYQKIKKARRDQDNH